MDPDICSRIPCSRHVDHNQGFTDKISTMLSEVESLHGELLNIVPDIHSLKKELDKLSKKLQTAKLQDDRRIKRFMWERDFLQPHIKEIMTDMKEMSKNIEEMLGSQVLDPVNEQTEQGSGVNSLSSEDNIWIDHGDDGSETANVRLHAQTNRPLCDCSSCAQVELLNKGLMLPELMRGTNGSLDMKKTCHICNKVVENGNAHMLEKHPDENHYLCQECGAEFKEFDGLWHHRLWHEHEKQNKVNQCHLCEKVFKTNVMLKRHLKKMHQGRSFLIKRKPAGQSKCVPSHRRVSKPMQKCTICSKHYINYRIHRALRCSVKIYLCPECNESFTSPTLYRKHLQEHNLKSGKRFKCEICCKVFATELRRDTHRSLHTGSGFGCDICGKIYDSVARLNLHKKRHKQYEFSCSLCTKVFKYFKSLEEHMNSHNGIKPYECDKCGKKFSTTISMGNHKLRMHSENYQGTTCKICGLKFNGEFARNTHYFKHTQEELATHNIALDKIPCDICGKVMRKYYLKRHKINKHGDEIKASCICEICGKAFKGEQSLKSHVLQHKKEQMAYKITADEGCEPSEYYPHICEICHKAFSSKQNLKLHKYLHADLKPFSCNICSKTFRGEAQLQFHMKYHSGDHSCKCHICGKTFMYRQVLATHINSHLNLRPYVCTTCGRGFNNERNMKRHVLTIHMGEKRFKCDFCNKCFSQKHIRDVHHNTHTGEKPHGCEICGQRFADPSTLHKHKAKHKKDLNWHEKIKDEPTDNSAAIRDSLISVYDVQGVSNLFNS